MSGTVERGFVARVGKGDTLTNKGHKKGEKGDDEKKRGKVSSQ